MIEISHTAAPSTRSNSKDSKVLGTSAYWSIEKHHALDLHLEFHAMQQRKGPKEAWVDVEFLGIDVIFGCIFLGG